MPSLDAESRFRPFEMMPVEVIPRVCPRNLRAGVIGSRGTEGVSGGAAGKMDREKSDDAVNSTREEGKKRSEVTVLRCGLHDSVGMACEVWVMWTEPSMWPVANCDPSGDTSRAVIFRVYGAGGCLIGIDGKINALTFRPSPSVYVLLGEASLVGSTCNDGHDAM